MDSNEKIGAREEAVHIFVSYAREDRRWLEADTRYNLVPFLAESLRRHNAIFWFDKKLIGGDEFRRHIEAEIDQAQIALLIVSQSFLNSAFIEAHEMPRIAERAQQGKMVVVPVLVEPCDWGDYPFLADRQMVPSANPLIDYTESEPQWARVRFQILDQIKAQLKRIRELQLQATLESRKPDAATRTDSQKAAEVRQSAATPETRAESPAIAAPARVTQPAATPQPAVTPQPHVTPQTLTPQATIADAWKPEAPAAPAAPRREPRTTFDVYISHSFKDNEIADQVCAALEAEGILCWVAPRDVTPGMEWDNEVMDAVKRARAVVLVFTASSNVSPRIRQELSYATNCGLAIVPVRTENILPTPETQYLLGTQKWFDALTPPLENHLKRLADNIKILLGRTGPYSRPIQPVGPQAASWPGPAAAPWMPNQPQAPPATAPEGPRYAIPAGIGPVARVETNEEAGTRRFHEWQSGGGTVVQSRFGKVPAWAWGGGAVSVLLLLVLFSGLGHKPAPEPGPSPETPSTSPTVPGPPTEAQITGTTWKFLISNGGTGTFTYEPGGSLQYTSSLNWASVATWTLTGDAIYMEWNSKYLEFNGTVSGTHMTGTATNKSGVHWTWTADEQ